MSENKASGDNYAGVDGIAEVKQLISYSANPAALFALAEIRRPYTAGNIRRIMKSLRLLFLIQLQWKENRIQICPSTGNPSRIPLKRLGDELILEKEFFFI